MVGERAPELPADDGPAAQSGVASELRMSAVVAIVSGATPTSPE